MIFNGIALLTGALVLGVGLYYLVKEKSDRESVKIYATISGVGALIVIAVLIKILIAFL